MTEETQPKPARHLRRPLSPAQLEQRRQAGKKGYAAYMRRVLLEYARPENNPTDEPCNYDLAARHVTGCRRAQAGFKYSRGLTSTCMREWAERLGLFQDPVTPTMAASTSTDDADPYEIPF